MATKTTTEKPEAKRDNKVSLVPKKERVKTKAVPAVDNILHLQRTIGNQAVQRLFKSGTLQAKLKIGQPNDKYEQEADRVADIVMRMPEPKLSRQTEEEEEEKLIQTKPIAKQITSFIQRQVEPDEEEEEPIQAKGNSSSTAEATAGIESNINSLKGGGQPLPESTRRYFEPKFSYDFSGVRVHTDSKASETAKSINAKAFTTGTNIVFNAGQYSPETDSGKHLLAHELTHVIQQAAIISDTYSSGNETLLCKPDDEQSTIPAPEIDTRAFWERIIKYKPTLRPRKEIKITIPPPPIPKAPKPPSKCPDASTARKKIRETGIQGDTENRMRRVINLERSRASVHKAFKLTKAMIKKTDRAIRKEFGSILPSRASFASPQTITVKSSGDFAKHRIPDDKAARDCIAGVAMKTEPDVLRQLCITKPTDTLYPVLVSEVASPLLAKLKINFVREFEASKIGGETTHTYARGKWSRHVTIPNEHRHMGHILVHEAMHYYVNDTFCATAAGHPLEQQLHEGGAEYLARRVIHSRLSSDPAFKVNYDSYTNEFTYVNTHLAIRSFPLAYFQGYVSLLGLTPKKAPVPTSHAGGKTKRP